MDRNTWALVSLPVAAPAAATKASPLRLINVSPTISWLDAPQFGSVFQTPYEECGTTWLAQESGGNTLHKMGMSGMAGSEPPSGQASHAEGRTSTNATLQRNGQRQLQLCSCSNCWLTMQKPGYLGMDCFAQSSPMKPHRHDNHHHHQYVLLHKKQPVCMLSRLFLQTWGSCTCVAHTYWYLSETPKQGIAHIGTGEYWCLIACSMTLSCNGVHKVQIQDFGGPKTGSH